MGCFRRGGGGKNGEFPGWGCYFYPLPGRVASPAPCASPAVLSSLIVRRDACAGPALLLCSNRGCRAGARAPNHALGGRARARTSHHREHRPRKKSAEPDTAERTRTSRSDAAVAGLKRGQGRAIAGRARGSIPLTSCRQPSWLCNLPTWHI